MSVEDKNRKNLQIYFKLTLFFYTMLEIQSKVASHLRKHIQVTA